MQNKHAQTINQATASYLTRISSTPSNSAETPKSSNGDALKRLQELVAARNPVKCARCNDRRFITCDVPVGHPMFGKATACPDCNRDALIAMSGLQPNERQISLTDIVTAGNPGTAQMVGAARVFIERGFRGLLSIYGTFGNGKTTTLKAIANAALDRNIEVRYMTMKEVMDYAREAFESQIAGDTDAGRITRVAKTRLLVIDELDKARLTDYAREVQTHLFDVRYRNAAEYGTVVAWNGDIRTIKDVMPWVASRLSEYPMIENKDADMRPLIGG